MQKIHEVIVRVKFNKPCTKSVAIHHIKEELKKKEVDLNDFGWDNSCPTQMEITHIKHNVKIFA